MFRRKKEAAPAHTDAGAPSLASLAIDTLASVLRSLAEFPVADGAAGGAQEHAEAWARHLTLATPPPGREAAPASSARDWQGIRQFVREHCRASARHAASVTSDFREVIWVFMRSFSEAFAANEEGDERIREQVARLERLVAASAPSELKREALDTVSQLTKVLEDRRQRQRAQMELLGDTVRSLGSELESARREGERDPLTKVANRRLFDEYLEHSVEVFGAVRSAMCLLIVDVDHFKTVNDSHGHGVGDQILLEVANAASRVFLRRSDLVARYGGDEFAIVLRDTTAADALLLAERLLAAARAIRVPAGGQEIAVTLSIGVGAIRRGDDARAWFDRADRGLYAAKRDGRGRAAIAPDDGAPALSRVA